MTIMLISAILISTLLIIVSYTISHKNRYPLIFSGVNEEIESRSQYECGLEPFEEELGIETRERFYIKFYIVGILFLIFDLETLLLFPGSLLFFNSTLPSIFNNSTLTSLTTITNGYKVYTVLFIFVLILILGLVYEYRKEVI